MNTSEMDLDTLAYSWLQGRFSMRSGFYAGRGPKAGDLNSSILEMFYSGIKKDVGDEAATNFVRFVNQLKDLSASAFIVAFERFWYGNCQFNSVEQSPEDRNMLSGHGRVLEAEAMGMIASVLYGSKLSEDEIEMMSASIKSRFIQAHISEIPPEELKSELRHNRVIW